MAAEEVWSNSSHGSSSEDGGSLPEGVAEMEANTETQRDNGGASIPNATALNDEATIPLFCGSSLSRLDTTLMFMNVCRTHKVTNACISELLHLLSKVILPTPNSLPSSEGMASTMLGRLGLRCDCIDV